MARSSLAQTATNPTCRTRRIDIRTTSAHWHQGRLPQEVQAIRLDRDTAIVTLPHEVFVELGMAIKSASPFRTTIVVSLANDLDFYIPTRRAFEEGHYEPTTCPLEPGCGEQLVRAAVDVLHELKPQSAPTRSPGVQRPFGPGAGP